MCKGMASYEDGGVTLLHETATVKDIYSDQLQVTGEKTARSKSCSFEMRTKLTGTPQER